MYTVVLNNTGVRQTSDGRKTDRQTILSLCRVILTHDKHYRNETKLTPCGWLKTDNLLNIYFIYLYYLFRNDIEPAVVDLLTLIDHRKSCTATAAAGVTDAGDATDVSVVEDLQV